MNHGINEDRVPLMIFEKPVFYEEIPLPRPQGLEFLDEVVTLGIMRDLAIRIADDLRHQSVPSLMRVGAPLKVHMLLFVL